VGVKEALEKKVIPIVQAWI